MVLSQPPYGSTTSWLLVR